MRRIVNVVMVWIFIIGPFYVSADQQNRARYEPKKKDKVLEEIKENRTRLLEKREDVTEQIRERQEEEKNIQEKQQRTLVTDMAGVFPPSSPERFKQVFHFPPVPQYYTSTCWSFSATSFFESEINRLSGKKIKLSEMWAPYFELIEKCRRFIRERGESYVAGGGESNSVTRMWNIYGIAPASAYSGVIDPRGRHDHVLLMKEIDLFLKHIKENDLWCEEDNLKHIALILDKYLGHPPSTFTYKEKTMTPLGFLQETGLNMADYVSVMSTQYFPFYTRQEFRVPDNWWHSREYINLPLDVFYKIIKKSIQAGYSLIIGGDVSEPGKLGTNDIAFIPTFDIPGTHINQDSREYRITNGSTEDDHGIHLVGYRRYRGHDWFLIKDSGRSARWGKHNGYYFFRGDFIKLKMLTFTVHKDMLADIMSRIKKAQ
jgi:bleomycin hydrolase